MSNSSLVRQGSFHTGELAPEFYGRTDQVAYQTGLRLARNFIPTPRGALLSRPGTKFVAEVKDSNAQVVLASFIFSDAQAYVLELGNLYVRFHHNGAQVLVQDTSDWSAVVGYAVTGITRKYGGTVYVLYNTAGLLVGDQPDTHPANWKALGAVGAPFEVVTPWATADLPRLKFAQSGDIITVTHQSYAPQEIARVSTWYWTVGAATFTAEPWFGGTFSYDRYKIASTEIGGTYSWDNTKTYAAGEYALADEVGADADSTGLVFIAARTTLNEKPGVVASTAKVWLNAVDEAHPAQEWQHCITAVYRDSLGVVRESAPSAAVGFTGPSYTDRPIGLQWTVPGAQSFVYQLVGFNIYKGRKGRFGYAGTAGPNDTTFVDNGITPDFTTQPPTRVIHTNDGNPFRVGTGTTGVGAADTLSYPAAVSYHEQRLLFGGSPARPGTFWGSMLASLKRFDVKSPVVASDPYEFALACVQLEDIRSLLSINGLLIFTGAGVWSARGVNGGVLSPTSVDVRRRSKGGASYLRPLEVRGNALYVTAKANRIRDVRINWAAYGDASFEQNDLSHYARHLFEGYTISDWCYAEEPFSLVWAVRSDGVLLSLSYDPATQTLAWAQHNTESGLASYEAACSIPEGTEDAVYVVVKRTINGATKRYIERFATRLLTDVRTYVGSDCGVAYDKRSTDGATLTLSGYASLAGGQEADVTASLNEFDVADPGDVLVFDPDGLTWDINYQLPWDTATTYAADATVAYKDEVWFSLQAGNVGHKPGTPDGATWWARANGPFRATILSYTSATQVHVVLDQPFGPNVNGTSRWGIARRTLTGLGHIEGKTVAVLGDGNVQSQQVVAGGSITVDTPVLIGQVGLPFNCDAELLDLGLDAVKTNAKIVSTVGVEVIGSRGLWAGEDLDHLEEFKAWRRVADSYGLPGLKDGLVIVKPKGSWNTGGRAVVRQVDPLPLSIVAVTREAVLGGRG